MPLQSSANQNRVETNAYQPPRRTGWPQPTIAFPVFHHRKNPGQSHDEKKKNPASGHIRSQDIPVAIHPIDEMEVVAANHIVRLFADGKGSYEGSKTLQMQTSDESLFI